jgi:hypothetical protein
METYLITLPYLPSIHWFRNFLRFENVYIEREENFVKSTYRNRCEIAGANSRQMLSIPLQGGRDHHRLYKETRILNDKRWQKIHWQSIRSAYGSAPFFEFYEDRFFRFYETEFEYLFDFNYQLLQSLIMTLKIDKSFRFTEVYETRPETTVDCRNVSKKEIETNPRYYQVFETRNGFQPNLSIIDLIFHEGPAAKDYLLRLK